MDDIGIGNAIGAILIAQLVNFITYFFVAYFIAATILIVLGYLGKFIKITVKNSIVISLFWIPGLLLSFFLTVFTGATWEAFNRMLLLFIPLTLVLLILFFFYKTKKRPKTDSKVKLIILISFITGLISTSYQSSLPDKQHKIELAIKEDFAQNMASLYHIVNVQKTDNTNRNFRITYSVPDNTTYIISIYGYSPKDNTENPYSIYGELSVIEPNGGDVQRLVLKNGNNYLDFSLKKDFNSSSVAYLDLSVSISPIGYNSAYYKQGYESLSLKQGISFCSPMIYQCHGYLFNLPEVKSKLMHVKLK